MSEKEQLIAKKNAVEDFYKSIDPLINILTPLIEQYDKLSGYLCYIITAWSDPSTYSKASKSLESTKNLLLTCKARCLYVNREYQKRIDEIDAAEENARLNSYNNNKSTKNSSGNTTTNNSQKLRPSYKSSKEVNLRF